MKNLRELAKAYAENLIDQETYRKSRSELIRSICAGETDAKKHDYLAPLDSMSDEGMDDTTENMVTQISSPEKKSSPTAAAKPQEQAQAQQKKPKSGKKSKPKSAPPPVYISPGLLDRKYVVVSIATVIILCLVTLVTLLIPDADDNPATDIVTQTAEPSSAGQLLITDFIQQKNWTETNLAAFVASWRQLSDQERTTATESPEMKRLGNTIYQQLLDERALLSLGDVATAVSKQQALVNFAKQIGIDDERLTVLEPAEEIKIEDNEIESGTTEEIVSNLKEETITEIENVNESNAQVEVAEKQVVAAEVALETVGLETIENKNDNVEVESTTIAAVDDSVNDLTNKVPQAIVIAEKMETKPVIQKAVSRAACNTSLIKSRKPFCRDKIEGIGYGPTMVAIQSGKFTMGGKLDDEKPAHTVSINAPFAMSVHEISFAEYDEFCQSTKNICPDQPWSGKDYPVVNVSHADAQSYTDWLTQKTGQSYRLPSEAEWEYAARAGTKTEYPFGDEILITNAVFSDVKTLSAPLATSDRSINRNKFRLYHMVGNVREWVADTWHAGYAGAPDDGSARIEEGQSLHVVRGGSYADSAEALRSGAREKLATADIYTGFRVLQEISE